MSNLTQQYHESVNYSNTIMRDIMKILDKKKIKYDINKKETEIVISSNKKTKEEIEDVIQSNIDIPKMVIMILIDIVKIGESLYIRQKTK